MSNSHTVKNEDPKGTGKKKWVRASEDRKRRLTYTGLKHLGCKMKINDSVIVTDYGNDVFVDRPVQIKEIFVEEGDRHKTV